VIKDSANYINGDKLVRFKIAGNQAQPQQLQQKLEPQKLQPQEFYGISISLSSKGGGQ
jgi:hypothetical protein